jgi:hypothetical protein
MVIVGRVDIATDAATIDVRLTSCRSVLRMLAFAPRACAVGIYPMREAVTSARLRVTARRALRSTRYSRTQAPGITARGADGDH